MSTVVLAFSGGLDTSFCAVWLAQQTGAEVLAVTVDTGGFTPEQLDALGARARELGCVEHVAIDARAAVYDRFVGYLILGNVLRGGTYPLSVGVRAHGSGRGRGRRRARAGRRCHRARQHGCRQRPDPVRRRHLRVGAAADDPRANPRPQLVTRAGTRLVGDAGCDRARPHRELLAERGPLRHDHRWQGDPRQLGHAARRGVHHDRVAHRRAAGGRRARHRLRARVARFPRRTGAGRRGADRGAQRPRASPRRGPGRPSGRHDPRAQGTHRVRGARRPCMLIDAHRELQQARAHGKWQASLGASRSAASTGCCCTRGWYYDPVMRDLEALLQQRQ